MDSALLRDKIDIYNLNVESTAYGTIQKSYKYASSTRAHVIFDSENQVVSEGEIFYPVNRTFIVRSYVEITERDRIKWKDQFWSILSINDNKYYNDKEIRTTLVNT